MDVAFLNMDRPYNKDLKVNTQGVFFVPPKDIYIFFVEYNNDNFR